MPGPAIAIAGASVAGGLASASAAKKAAEGQSRSADAATNLQREIFYQTSENFAPFLNAGSDAMSAYLYEMGLGPKPMVGAKAQEVKTINTPARGRPGGINSYKVGGKKFTTLGEAEEYASKNKVGGTEYQGYQVSPMARYLMDEGVDSIEGSAASAGGLYSGATLEALEGNRRNVIGADTSDYFSKLFGLSNMGMSAAGNQASAGSSYANNVGNIQMQNAQAQGQYRMQGAQALNSTLGDLAGTYGYFSNPMAAYAAPTMMGGFGGGR